MLRRKVRNLSCVKVVVEVDDALKLNAVDSDARGVIVDSESKNEYFNLTLSKYLSICTKPHLHRCKVGKRL